MSPSTTPQTCGIILDGRLPGLLAAWAETVCRTPSGTHPIAWLSPLPMRAPVACRRAAGQQTELCGMGDLVELPPVSGSAASGEIGGLEETDMLLAACHRAMDAEVARVIWPVHLGATSVAEVDLDAIADVCDRSMLVAQLANLESGRTGVTVRIETPYADFTDSQLMELAIDMGAPLGAAWWCEREGQRACAECPRCRRWQAALTKVQPGATLAGLVAKNQGSRTAVSPV